MKYILFVIDGAADCPQEVLGGKTPLEYADSPYLNSLCEKGVVGTAVTIPEGCVPGTEAAFLTVFGADARGAGRAALEAAGLGIKLLPGETGMRANLICALDGKLVSHSSGGVEDEEAAEIVAAINSNKKLTDGLAEKGLRLIKGECYRQILAVNGDSPDAIPPHNHLGEPFRPLMIEKWADLMLGIGEFMAKLPVNDRRRAEGKLPVNMLWPWGGGKNAKMWNIKDKFGVRGAAVAGVPIVKGVARLSGMDALDVPGANGEPDTDWQAKVNAAIETLKTHDFLLLHLEAPDELAHGGDAMGKAGAIRTAGEMIRQVKASLDEDCRIMLLSDHYTLSTTRAHDGTPTPFCIFDSREGRLAGCKMPFTEKSANSGVHVLGAELLPLLFEKQ